MAFCTNCGTNVPDGIKFCTSCGTPMSVQAQPQAPPPPQQTYVLSRNLRLSHYRSRLMPRHRNRLTHNLNRDTWLRRAIRTLRFPREASMNRSRRVVYRYLPVDASSVDQSHPTHYLACGAARR